MARLYVDENFPLKAVHALRELGHDVLTTLEAGNANQGITDSDVLAYAVSTGRVVATFNRRDFIRLHLASPIHAGVVVCTQDANPIQLAKRIDQAIDDRQDLTNQLLRVNRPQE